MTNLSPSGFVTDVNGKTVFRQMTDYSKTSKGTGTGCMAMVQEVNLVSVLASASQHSRHKWKPLRHA